jgi:hypothetical protein
MKNTLAGLVAIGLLLLVGCGSSAPKPGPVTEAKDIVGTWMAPSSIIKYDEDGTFRLADSREGLRHEVLCEVGEFWFEDGQYFTTITKASERTECLGMTGVYEVQLLENGNLQFSVAEDECTIRNRFWPGEHVRVDWRCCTDHQKS